MNKLSLIGLFDNVYGFELIDVSVLDEIMLDKDLFEFCDVIENFDFEDCEIKLVKSVGYRGEGCYEGLIVRDGVKYFVDVVNGEIERIVE